MENGVFDRGCLWYGFWYCLEQEKTGRSPNGTIHGDWGLKPTINQTEPLPMPAIFLKFSARRSTIFLEWGLVFVSGWLNRAKNDKNAEQRNSRKPTLIVLGLP